MRKLKKLASTLLVSLLLYLPLSAETYYTITETELTTLENNLMIYKTTCESLKIQTEQLKVSCEKLEKENRQNIIKTSLAVGGITFLISVPIGIIIGEIIGGSYAN